MSRNKAPGVIEQVVWAAAEGMAVHEHIEKPRPSQLVRTGTRGYSEYMCILSSSDRHQDLMISASNHDELHELARTSKQPKPNPTPKDPQKRDIKTH